jgi:transcriptional regulator with XRE-family HTH domain
MTQADRAKKAREADETREAKALGDRIRTAREKAGLGMNELDRAIGQGSGYTSPLEKGEKASPDYRIIADIAKILTVRLEWILTGTGRVYDREAGYENLKSLIRKDPRAFTYVDVVEARAMNFGAKDEPSEEKWRELIKENRAHRAGKNVAFRTQGDDDPFGAHAKKVARRASKR